MNIMATNHKWKWAGKDQVLARQCATTTSHESIKLNKHAYRLLKYLFSHNFTAIFRSSAWRAICVPIFHRQGAAPEILLFRGFSSKFWSMARMFILFGAFYGELSSPRTWQLIGHRWNSLRWRENGELGGAGGINSQCPKRDSSLGTNLYSFRISWKFSCRGRNVGRCISEERWRTMGVGGIKCNLLHIGRETCLFAKRILNTTYFYIFTLFFNLFYFFSDLTNSPLKGKWSQMAKVNWNFIT